MNLLTLPDLEKIMERIDKKTIKPGTDKIKFINELFESAAKEKNIELKLRKKQIVRDFEH